MRPTAAEYWADRRARADRRAIARARLRTLPDAPAYCSSCLRPLTRVGDTLYCLAPVVGPRSCTRAYTD